MTAALPDLIYEASDPPLEVTFAVRGGHYSGVVNPGCLFLQPDISEPPIVRWKNAKVGGFYTLLMIDFDGNAYGAWPDAVAPGRNSPVRHWIVGNISGERLSTTGYVESLAPTEAQQPSILQAYRPPHIPVISDRYGVYLFCQEGWLEFAEVPPPITCFNHTAFLRRYQLSAPVATNWFVAVYTSESPFSGKPFHGNDVGETWHKELGQGELLPSSQFFKL